MTAHTTPGKFGKSPPSRWSRLHHTLNFSFYTRLLDNLSALIRGRTSALLAPISEQVCKPLAKFVDFPCWDRARTSTPETLPAAA